MKRNLVVVVAILLMGGCATNPGVSTSNKGVGYLLDEYRVCLFADSVIGGPSDHYESLAYHCKNDGDDHSISSSKPVGGMVFKVTKIGNESDSEITALQDGYKAYLHLNNLVEDKQAEVNRRGYRFFYSVN
jgi:hypothetical protein